MYITYPLLFLIRSILYWLDRAWGVGGVGSRLKDFNFAGNSMRIIKQLPVSFCAGDTKKGYINCCLVLIGIKWKEEEHRVRHLNPALAKCDLSLASHIAINFRVNASVQVATPASVVRDIRPQSGNQLSSNKI